jgi:hypothetical protein
MWSKNVKLVVKVSVSSSEKQLQRWTSTITCHQQAGKIWKLMLFRVSPKALTKRTHNKSCLRLKAWEREEGWQRDKVNLSPSVCKTLMFLSVLKKFLRLDSELTFHLPFYLIQDLYRLDEAHSQGWRWIFFSSLPI